MNIKLIALDLDGTLLTSEKVIDPITRDSLLKAQQQGIHLVIASGRDKGSIPFVSTPLRLEEGQNYVAGVNGQVIYDYAKKEYWLDTVFEATDAKRVMALGKKYNVEVVSCCGYDYYALLSRRLKFKKWLRSKLYGEPMDYGFKKGKQRFIMIHDPNYHIEADINKFVLIQSEAFFKKHLAAIRQELKDYDIYEVGPAWIEIMPKGVSKGSAISKIAQSLGITKDEIMVFGDAENDLSMFDVATYGIAMGNAMDSVKEKAFAICPSNDACGIAKALDLYVFHNAK